MMDFPIICVGTDFIFRAQFEQVLHLLIHHICHVNVHV